MSVKKESESEIRPIYIEINISLVDDIDANQLNRVIL